MAPMTRRRKPPYNKPGRRLGQGPNKPGRRLGQINKPQFNNGGRRALDNLSAAIKNQSTGGVTAPTKPPPTTKPSPTPTPGAPPGSVSPGPVTNTKPKPASEWSPWKNSGKGKGPNAVLREKFGKGEWREKAYGDIKGYQPGLAKKIGDLKAAIGKQPKDPKNPKPGEKGSPADPGIAAGPTVDPITGETVNAPGIEGDSGTSPKPGEKPTKDAATAKQQRELERLQAAFAQVRKRRHRFLGNAQQTKPGQRKGQRSTKPGQRVGQRAGQRKR